MTNALTVVQNVHDIENMEEGRALVAIRTNPQLFPHFYTFSQEEKNVRIKALMLKCYQMRHIKDINYITYDSQDLIAQIEKDKRYRDMSFEEIRTAFTNGAVDKYGECKGLTVAFFLKCLDSYIEENRLNYIESVRQKEMLERKERDKELLENVKLRLEESKRRAAMERAAQEMVENNKINDRQTKKA